MRGRFVLAGMLALSALTACSAAENGKDRTSSPGSADPMEFKAAELKVEVNATDGDAGLQLFLDHEPWRSVQLQGPDGSMLLEVSNRGNLEGYGLTELFSESSEPPFTEFPLEQFKKLFAEGSYRLTGTTVDGVALESSMALSHDFPAGPRIVAPEGGATVPNARLVVRWDPDASDIEINRYQVLVVDEGSGRELSVELDAAARSLEVPAGFLAAGDFKAEVLAIAANGNQTLTEVEFSVE